MELLSFPSVVRFQSGHNVPGDPRSRPRSVSLPSPSLLELERQQITRLGELTNELHFFLQDAVPQDGGRRLRKEEIKSFLARIRRDRNKVQQDNTPSALKLTSEGRPHLQLKLQSTLEDLDIAMGIYEKMIGDAPGEKGRVGLSIFGEAGNAAIVLVPTSLSTSPTERNQVVETGPDRLMLSSSHCYQSLAEEPLANSPTLIVGPDKHCPRCGSPLAILTSLPMSSEHLTTTSRFEEVGSSQCD
jgi:hypothetical protein